MKFSEQWLREWVNPPISTETLADQLTMAGMEVEDVVAAAPPLDDVVVARVEQVTAHPDADKLSVCTVKKDAGAPVTVVTGAPGVQPGRCYAYAGVGARLPGSVVIKETKIRGVTSAGMLCSAAELQLSDDADELFLLADDAEPGAALAAAMQLDDRVFDIGLTPNRGDCLSIQGIAREVAVINGMQLDNLPDDTPVAAVHEQVRNVSLDAPDACPRYLGRIITNIDMTCPSPLWLREKLRRCGLRSLNAVVDVTNYVMLELGQPLHAFDNDRLNGAIAVRFAAEGEEITLLDGETHPMPASTLVIADAARALAMAGVMGGLDSAVSATTRRLFLESAFFDPLVVAGRARQFGMHTDASHRFERGVDFSLQRRALERATRLLLDICGGEPGPVIEALAQQALPQRQAVGMRPAAAAELLGEAISMETCTDILTRLGLEPATDDAAAGCRRFNVPPHRFDISLEADLVEEVARIYGYRNINSALPPARLGMRRPGFRDRIDSMRQALVGRGYQEAITYSFVSHDLQSRLFPDTVSIALLNAISVDMERMRVSLWPGLLGALRYNLNRRQARVRLFETGKVFSADGAVRQSLALSGLSYGATEPEQWSQESAAGDFYDIKSDVESVISACCGQAAPEYMPAVVPALHHGKAARIIVGDQPIGLIGALHPAIQDVLEIETEVCLFELCLDKMPETNQVKYKPVSKFPVVKRDLSILVDEDIPIVNLLNNVSGTNLNVELDSSARESKAPGLAKFLADLELVDVYQGLPVPKGKKSVTLGLTFQRLSDTLIHEHVDSMMSQILDSLYREFDAQLRE